MAVGVVVFVAVLVVVLARSPAVPESVRPVHGNPVLTSLAASPQIAADCPWLARAMGRQESPERLASLVVRRMTLTEKLDELVLTSLGPYENVNSGVPRLCIPPLSLQDGPQGLAYGDVGVTQLPAPLALAATFDVGLARSYGSVLGAEARGQSFDVVQGPTLDLFRVPEDGRGFETFGEDPLLAADLGVADVEGIQSHGVMAQAKEFVAYSQETDRGALDDQVAERALQELYFPPFEAAVEAGRVASVMCAYPQLDGTYQCEDGALLGQLRDWGFEGFVRSDLGAVHDPVAALTAGTSLLKPGSVAGLFSSVREGLLPQPVVDTAVEQVLAAMFRAGVIGREPAGDPGDPVDLPGHAAVARAVAERAAVLLQNRGGILPLSTGADPTVAVIGAAARSDPVVTGFGSSRVQSPFVSAPLAALRRRAGRSTRVTYASGGGTTAPLPPVPPRYLTPASGQGNGLTFTLLRQDAVASAMQTVEPTVDTSVRPYPGITSLMHGTGPQAPIDQRTAGGGTGPALGSSSAGSDRRAPGPSIGERPTRSDVVLPPTWNDVAATWTGTLTPPTSGLYTFSVQGSGAAQVFIDGSLAVSDPLSHVLGRWSQTVSLTGGRPVSIEVAWDPFDNLRHNGPPTVVASSLTLGWKYVSADIADAVAAARQARVAVVFAGDYNAESFDRPSLSLPGDQNDLISAVAAANPRTVVVLDTGGPVLMPWLSQVAAVVEDWYPGEEDGNAIAAILYGDVDPSGRLPVTFPTSAAQSAINSPSQWPGVDLVSDYSEGLDVGYRYDHATGTTPLFAFGSGLSYTTFRFSALSVRPASGGATVSVRVADVGRRAGTAVPEVYVTQPPAAGEPPAQLAAFDAVRLRAHSARQVTMFVPARAFQAYLGGRWTSVPGTDTVAVGPSSASLPLQATLPSSAVG